MSLPLILLVVVVVLLLCVLHVLLPLLFLHEMLLRAGRVQLLAVCLGSHDEAVLRLVQRHHAYRRPAT